MNTSLKDKNGKTIRVGDTLQSDYGFKVIVQADETGKLVADANHSCANIPYSLGTGQQYCVL
jgi:hypothetical protein